MPDSVNSVANSAIPLNTCFRMPGVKSAISASRAARSISERGAGCGSASARFSQTLHLSFDKDKEEEFRKSRVPHDNYFKLRPGKYRLKLAVSDEKNNLGTAEQILEIPAPPEKEYTASSLVIPEQLTRLPPLIQNLQTRLLDADDPMMFRGVQITPSVEHRLRVNAGIPVLFQIYNLTGNPNNW
jgi:hypothetical protein